MSHKSGDFLSRSLAVPNRWPIATFRRKARWASHRARHQERGHLHNGRKISTHLGWKFEADVKQPAVGQMSYASHGNWWNCFVLFVVTKLPWDLRCQDWCNTVQLDFSVRSQTFKTPTFNDPMLHVSWKLRDVGEFFWRGPKSSHHYVHNPHSTTAIAASRTSTTTSTTTTTTTTTTTSTYYHGVSCEVITCMQCPRRSSNRLLVGERWRVAGYDHCRKMALLTPTDCSFQSGRYLPVASGGVIHNSYMCNIFCEWSLKP